MSSTRALKAALLGTLLLGCGAAQRNLPAPKAGAPDDSLRTPRTVAEAVRYTLEQMHELDRNALRGTRREDLSGFLHGYQMSARYAFGLSDGSNRELLRSCGSEQMVLEDCLLIVLQATWDELQRRDTSRVTSR